ncbi:MAG: OmpA family protein [Halobacteriovoraceae bacterium]|nr:OmpA family protein [Halobacteriovoraceae bacterium]
MADEADNNDSGGGGGGGAPAGDAPAKCPDCPPGLPGWMATFSDLVTLLLTFFVLLLSFAKTETAKYEAALGSVRDAFGGNVLKQGEVIQSGKSPDDSPTMLESQEPIRSFPIEFLTTEGFLDKHEVNRESTEILKIMRSDLKDFELVEDVDVYEQPEGIMVRLKEKIFFKPSSLEVVEINTRTLTKVIKLLNGTKWKVFVEGHASKDETDPSQHGDAFTLSSQRALRVTKLLINGGIAADRITTVFYGDTRPNSGYDNGQDVPEHLNRRVEFILRKTDLRDNGKKTDVR